MNNFKKPESLEEKAIVSVAVNLCQASDFKETALCLEKPTYGIIIPYSDGDVFVSDSKALSLWAALKEQDDPEYATFAMSCCYSRLERWDRQLEQLCQRLTEALPFTFKLRVQAWMNGVALEYLSYCRRQEALFGLTRYFLMDFVKREDWNESGRLDEKRLAERLSKDERLTVLQRYRISCVYCLQLGSRNCTVADLWKQLTLEEKVSLSGEDDPNRSSEKNRLVLLWSYFMDRRRDEKVTGRKKYRWRYALQQAVEEGNRVAMMTCWKQIGESTRQSMVLKVAFIALNGWLSAHPGRDSYTYVYNNWRERLILVETSHEISSGRQFNLPFYYSDLLCFFLSEMSEEDQLTFFKKAFQYEKASHVLECFLVWPHQDYFLPTIRKLWGILPQYNYHSCLFVLSSKYNGDYYWKFPRINICTKEDGYYDYQSLLFQLWEETPEDYKRYVLTHEYSGYPPKETFSVFLFRLLKRCPFKEADKHFFKRVFNELDSDGKKALLRWEGEDMFRILIERENWSLINWILEECLPANETVYFKKQLNERYWGLKFCINKLLEHQEIWLKNFLDWSLESNEERKEFKEKLIFDRYCLETCQSLFCEGNFSEVEQMINFCLPSEEKKKEFKTLLIKHTCWFMLANQDWDEANKFLTLCFDSEEEIVTFKKEILLHERTIGIHYNLVFEGLWEDLKRFHEWFDLLDEEIKSLKKETIFCERSLLDMIYLLRNCEYITSPENISHLQWCLTDEQIIVDFKEKLSSRFIDGDYFKQRINYLIEELLSGLRKDAQLHCEDLEGGPTVSLSEEQAHSSIQTRGEKRALEEAKEQSQSPKRMTT